MIFGQRELNVADIQAVSNLSGVQQLLAQLGYDSREPVQHTSAALGIAERVHPLIRQVWRLVQQPGGGLPLEIYWFEVTALTADLRRGVVAAFRNKPINALCILTTRDFDPLDFVLVERSLGHASSPGGQVTVSYRLLSVARRQPARVHLRALGRMRNTAADPYAQYERIRDAFRLAEWSEDEFNNRNLFSDYFLKQRLPAPRLFPAWDSDVQPAHRELTRICREAGDLHALDRAAICARFIAPLLDGLGFAYTALHDPEAEADYLLRPKDGTGPDCAALLVYPWDRPLDRQDDQDRDRPDHVTGIRVIRALHRHQLSWAILTNGKDWRLYCA
jgi:hypothetical protein